MRRSSLFAPLLLIGLGVLFLARNLYPNLPVMDFIARYWPYILILWGGLRLLEILYWAATSKPLPPNGISGGEWILVVFLCLVGSGMTAVRGYHTWWPHGSIRMGGLDVFGESFEYPLSAEKPAAKAPHIVIENFRGNARVTGGDVDTVKVTGRKTVRALEQSDADKANQNTPFELVSQGDRVIVRTNQDRINGGYRISADLDLTVPKGASLEARGRSGSFDIANLAGGVEINSDSAGVRLRDIGGDVRLDLRRSDIVRAVNVKGGVDLRGHGADIDIENAGGQVTVTGTYMGVVQFTNLAQPLRFEGPQTELNIEKLPGQVRMALGDFTGSNLVGPIRLTARSRDVTIGDFTQSLDLSLDRGDIDLRPGKLPLARMDVRTHSGDIELAVPPAAKFAMKASTSHGEITNDYGSPLQVESEGPGASLSGGAGDGPMVTLTSGRGSVTVRKASPNDKPVTLPAEPPALPKPPKLPAPLQPLTPVQN